MRILYVTRHFNHSGYLILERLIQEGFDIVGVLLHADADPWRGRWSGAWRRALYRLKCRYYGCEPLRTLAQEERLARAHGLNIIWADSIKDDRFYADLQRTAPDIIVLGGGWHELLPERVYDHPPLGCINTHPSLLPMFRGTSITRWQVLHGVDRSGSTIHYVDGRFDTGGALAQGRVEVPDHWSPQRLFFELGKAGADLMVPLLRRFEKEGRVEPFLVEHDERHYRYFKRWTWSMERLRIDWSLPLRDLHFFVLACTQESYEYLGPFFGHQGIRYILRTTELDTVTSEAERMAKGRKGLVVVAGSDRTLTLYREGEEHVLRLGMVQVFDRWYKWRRARPFVRRSSLRPGDLFVPENTLT